jgi:hypothetical protein
MPRPVTILLPAVIAMLALAGCDPAVQARYMPTSVEEGFSSSFGVDREVLELPAAPPALDVADMPQRNCRPPGQTLKPVDMVGLRDDTTRMVTIEPTLLAGTYEPPLPSPPPGPAYRIASWTLHEEVGAKESISSPPFKPTAEPGHSVQRIEPMPMGIYRRDVYSWCEPQANLR